jgi:uncharacterized protein YcnI
MRTRLALAAAIACVALLVAAPAALAHARVSPAVSLAGELQLYSLAVPTEKAGLQTTKIVMTVPKGFGIDSFVPAPGWTMSARSHGSGEDTVVQQVTWTGGHTPTGDDSLFQFLAQPASPGTYTFRVLQTYSDGSLVDWSGSESSEDPAPAITAVSSLGGGGGGGGSTTLEIVAVALGALALIVAVGGLLARGGGGRDLA